MHKRIFHFLTHHFKKPIFFYSRPWGIIGLNVVLSALIMIFYEPFGYRFDSWAEFTQLVGFCVIAFFCSVLFFLCIPEEPHVQRWMKHWTIGKNCIYSFLFLLTTGLSISFYDFHLIMQYRAADYGSHAFYICLLTDVVGTFTIGVVPLCVGLMLERTYHLKKDLENIRRQRIQSSPASETVPPAKELGKQTEESVEQTVLTSTDKFESVSDNDQSVLLTGDTKESLEISPYQILYLEASGNYVNVYYQQAKQSRKIIRTTFRNMEEQLTNYPFLVRCHRTYMVNINFVTLLDRNEQGYHLVLQNSTKEIPVSRTYLKELKAILKL